MKLKQCLLNVDVAVTAPLIRRGPDESWLLAYKNKSIPESLYKFYLAADNFSYDRCPDFLKDDRKILFAHLETSVNLIKLSFEEYHELIDLMKKYDLASYTPVKEARGQTFDPSAPKQFNRCLQLLIINMYSILDCISEAVAIVISWGKIGRASFLTLVEEVKKSSNTSIKTIVKVDNKYIKEIKKVIREEIQKEGNSKEWYELFKLYRNKSSHFRHWSSFSFHDKKGNFYHFLPRQWPYYFQQDIKYKKEEKVDNNNDVKNLISDLLMEQDIFEYCEGLYNQIYIITERIFHLLTEAFNIKKDCGCDISCDTQKRVVTLTSKYKFKHF